jgi:hypothetical protein
MVSPTVTCVECGQVLGKLGNLKDMRKLAKLLYEHKQTAGRDIGRNILDRVSYTIRIPFFGSSIKLSITHSLDQIKPLKELHVHRIKYANATISS